MPKGRHTGRDGDAVDGVAGAAQGQRERELHGPQARVEEQQVQRDAAAWLQRRGELLDPSSVPVTRPSERQSS